MGRQRQENLRGKNTIVHAHRWLGDSNQKVKTNSILMANATRLVPLADNE